MFQKFFNNGSLIDCAKGHAEGGGMSSWGLSDIVDIDNFEDDDNLTWQDNTTYGDDDIVESISGM